MLKRIIFFSIFLFLLGYIIFAPHIVFAQEETEDKGISVSPVKFELEGKPGENLKGQIKYFNYTKTEKTLFLHTYNFIPQGESNVPQFVIEKEEEYKTTLKDWIELDNSEITVAPVEPVKIIPTIVNFAIQIPSDASPGGYYAAVIQSERDPTDKNFDTSGTVISPESACLFILNVTGDVQRIGTSESFSVVDPFEAAMKSKSLFEFPPVKFIVRIRNSGNTHFKPQGNIFLYKGDEQIATYQVNEGEGNVLRDSVRMFEEEIWGDDTFLYRVPKLDEDGNEIKDDDGNTKTYLKVNWDRLSKIPFGKYRAKLSLVYDDNNEKKTIEDELSFWILPWRILLLILIILITIIGLILLKQSRKNRSRKNDES